MKAPASVSSYILGFNVTLVYMGVICLLVPQVSFSYKVQSKLFFPQHRLSTVGSNGAECLEGTEIHKQELYKDKIYLISLILSWV